MSDLNEDAGAIRAALEKQDAERRAGEAGVRDAVKGAEPVAFPSERFTGKWDDGDLALTPKARNDIGNSERLRARFGQDLKYVRDVGWHVWCGTHWEQDGGEEAVRKYAQQTAVAIRREVNALSQNPPDGMMHKAVEDMVDSYAKWAGQSGNSNRLAAMVTEARPHLTVGPMDMDADPLLLNVLNGTMVLDGACDQLRPHAREDHITKCIDVEYDPDATCQQFNAFLARVQPDDQVRVFLQQWFGYTLTGLTHEQKLVFFFGEGANGKSVLMDVVARIMGAYSCTLPFASLLRDDNKRGGDASPDLARLPGRRFVRASEPEKGAMFSEALIKSVTGGEEMTVRQLRKEFFDFKPQFKLTLSGNHRPRVKGQDHGIWRRLKLVPWEVIIPEEEWDIDLTSKLYAERSGIFNWMLEGLRMYLEDGLRIPKAIEDATAEYRTDSDPLGLFIARCIRHEPGGAVRGSAMYDAYLDWCKAEREKPWSNTAFGKALPERGFHKDRSTGTVMYLDVVLHDVPSAHDYPDDGPDGAEEG